MRTRNRLLTVAAAAFCMVAGVAGPALAHVEVSADKTTAGAENVTLTFTGEAESDSAGIASERIVLPAGITPASVTLVKAPPGWAFKQTADGFTVGGKALAMHTDAEWKVKIAKLPDGATRLSFKTLETYGNGDVVRWIEIQQAGQPEPDNPAPLVTLKAGPKPSAGSPSAAPSSAVPPSAPAAATTPASSTTAPALQSTDQGGSTWWVWLIVAVLVVAALVAVVLRRRRS